LSLCLTKHHVMNAYGGVDVYLHVLLTSALDGGEWPASRSSSFTPVPTEQGAGCCGEEKKNSQPLPGIQPRTYQFYINFRSNFALNEWLWRGSCSDLFQGHIKRATYILVTAAKNSYASGTMFQTYVKILRSVLTIVSGNCCYSERYPNLGSCAEEQCTVHTSYTDCSTLLDFHSHCKPRCCVCSVQALMLSVCIN